MKSILKSYQQPTLWPFFLAQVVLAVNTHYDHDLQSTPAFRAYGFSLTTPGIPNWVDPDTQRFIIHKRQPTQKKEYISPDWETATHAYIRILQRKHKLAPLYKGPFRIIDRQDQSMFLDVDGNLKRISYLHLHPLHFTPQDDSKVQSQVSHPYHKKIKKYSFFEDLYWKCKWTLTCSSLPIQLFPNLLYFSSSLPFRWNCQFSFTILKTPRPCAIIF